MTVRTTKDAINIREELESLKGNREDFTVSGTFTVSGKLDVNADGDITFGDDQVFFDASTGRLGIGTSSPSDVLHVLASANVGGILVGNATNSTAGQLRSNFNTFEVRGDTNVDVYTNDTNRMRVDSSGNVGIGTTSPTANLDVWDASLGNIAVFRYTGGTNSPRIELASVSDTVMFIDTSAGTTAPDLAFGTGGSERMRINSSGNVGIGTTSPNYELTIGGNDATASVQLLSSTTGTGATNGFRLWNTGASCAVFNYDNTPLLFATNNTERMRIDSSGNVLVGTTSVINVGSGSVAGHDLRANGVSIVSAASTAPSFVRRTGNDGTLISLYQDNVEEGSISVSGTTVSYNGGHLSRWSRLPAEQGEPTLYKGTVMTNLDTMVNWEGEENEQLNETEVSSVEGDPNVAGLFVAWDESDELGDYYLAMTGDLVIRIAEGVTVQRGDLLMSAGDGTAKPQGDDIVRSKTIAKVTSTNVSHTYPDGSYAVPCVVMAC